MVFVVRVVYCVVFGAYKKAVRFRGKGGGPTRWKTRPRCVTVGIRYESRLTCSDGTWLTPVL